MAAYLLDTNIILRFAQRSHPLNPVVRQKIRQLLREGHQLHITSQNCIEFWNVATRPKDKNGFGLTPVHADRLLRRIERLFIFLEDSPVIYTRWRTLVVRYGVSGVQVHDARLVAAMRVHEIRYILTFNTSDFKRYAEEGIIAVSP
jgi:predicted nucleic acid-binding protein